MASSATGAGNVASYLVTIGYEVQAETPGQAIDLVGKFCGDLHYALRQELKERLGHEAEVKTVDCIVQVVLTRDPDGKIATVSESLV